MKNHSVYIRSTGYYIPEGKLTHKQILDDLANLNHERFSEDEMDLLLYGSERKFDFLGLNSRSLPMDDDQENYLTMGLSAARIAIENAQMAADNIDCVIVCGLTNPFFEPSAAIVFANFLELKTRDCFDVNDTCNGFMKSLDIASLYLESGRYENILLIASENPFSLVDGLRLSIELETPSEIDNRLSGLIAGSGAGAVLLTSRPMPGKKLLQYSEKRDLSNWEASYLKVPFSNTGVTEFDQYDYGFRSDAKRIASVLIRDMPDFIKTELTAWEVDINDIDHFIMHQLGRNINYAILDKLKVDHDKIPVSTFSECGNMATANIPVNLALADEQSLISKGEKVLLLGSACGLSYAMSLIEW